MEKTERKNEIIEHEWTTLKLLWDRCKEQVADAKVRAEIDALFPKCPTWSSAPEDWRALNEAEQRVGMHLDPNLLNVEYQALLDIAEARRIPTLSRHRDEARIFTGKEEGLAQQRAVYLSFLQILQAGFVETRFSRRLRRETAVRLFTFGLAVLGLALLTPAIIWWSRPNDGDIISPQHFGSVPGFGVAMAAAFGVLGAYFSRVTTFQAKLSSLGFEEVMNLYHWRMLLVRLLFGAIGAIVLYYVLCSGLIRGPMFPEFPGVGGSKAALGSDFLAKLLVWSFLAGFSERLVPDTVEGIGSRASRGRSRGIAPSTGPTPP